MISRLGIIANLDKPRVGRTLRGAVESARSRGLEVYVERAVVEGLQLDAPARPPESLAAEVDLLVSFGGDGTFLRAARLAGDTATPLLGINLGSLGFLAEVRVEEIEDAWESLRTGEYMLEKRRRVAAEVHRDGRVVFDVVALNDVVLNMGSVPRAIDLEFLVDDICVGRYLADGLIVATPTGSTAYNLSAGGPIVEASMDALVINPICPHTLGVRPLILDVDRSVEIRLHDCDSARLSGDGQVTTAVQTGDRILVPPTDTFCYFLRLPRRNLFQIIQEKLRWGGLPRERGASTTGEPE